MTNFIFYILVVVAAGTVIVACLCLLKKSGKPVRFNYTHRPAQEIVYYEIINDIIQQMRLKMGNEALKIVRDIPGLKINPHTGYIDSISSENQPKIISTLITRYEKILGKPISFSLPEKKI